MQEQSPHEKPVDFMFIVNRDGSIRYVSESVSRGFGLDPSAVVGRPLSAVFPPKAAQVQTMMIDEVFRTGKPIIAERKTRMLSHDAWYEFTFLPLTSSNGIVDGAMGMARDISARKAEEAHLRYLSSIVDSSDDAIIGKDLEGKVMSWNKGAESLYGYSKDEIVGRSIMMIFPQELSGELAPLLAKIRAGKRIESFNTQRLRKDGSKIDVAVTISPVVNGDGKVVGASTIARDITQLKRVADGLRESEEKFSRAFKVSPEMITIISVKDLSVMDVNETFLEVTGFSRGEVLGRSLVDLGVLRKDAVDMLARSFSGKDELRNIEVEFRTKEGSNRVALASVHGIEIRNERCLLISSSDMTERKRFENALKESLERRTELELIIDRSPAIVFLWEHSPGWPVVFVSSNISQFGYSADDFMSKRITFANLVHPDDLERVDAESEKYSIEGAKGYSQEYRILTKSGEVRWVDDRTVIRRDSNGVSRYHQGVVVDITERRIAEEQVRILSRAVEQSASSIVITDVKGDIEYVNPQFSKLTGYSAEEVAGRNPRILKSGEIPAEGYKSLWETITSGNDWRGEFHNKKKDGELYWEAATISPIFDSNRRIAHFVAVKEDITERKQMADALRQSEARFRAIVESSPLGIFLGNPNGSTTYVNPALTRMTGLSSREMLGAGWSKALHSEDRERVAKEWQTAIESGRLFAGMGRYMHDDGTVVWWDVRTAPIIVDSKIRGFVGLVQDITERKHMEDALKNANEKLNLMGSATRHDAMNQLAVMNAWLQLSLEEEKDVSIKKNLEHLKSASEGLQNLLEFTSSYQEIGVKEPVWLDLKDTILSSIAGISLKGIQLNNDFPPTEVYADAMLSKVFLNLIENSIRHGGKVTRIRIWSGSSDAGTTLYYEDDGVGIPVADKERVFDRGFGKHTGFGLYMVRTVLGITGISVKETGEPGKGVRFEMTVPRDKLRLSQG